MQRTPSNRVGRRSASSVAHSIRKLFRPRLEVLERRDTPTGLESLWLLQLDPVPPPVVPPGFTSAPPVSAIESFQSRLDTTDSKAAALRTFADDRIALVQAPDNATFESL